MTSDPVLSIIAPCRNEEAGLPVFFEAVRNEMARLDLTWEIICINDGSTDASLDVMLAERRQDERIRIITLTRGFGKEAALTAGLDRAAGQAVIPMDVDLQDPVELIAQMVAKWREGHDIVYASRQTRYADSFAKRVTAGLFYRTFNRATQVPIPPNAGDFRLMDRRVVAALRQMPERVRFMKGMFSWPGFRQAEVRYERPARRHGVSSFTYWRLWNFAWDGLTSFTTLPLRVWTYCGMLVAGISFLYAIIIITRTLIFGADVPGYASLMVVVLFLGGAQLISLGIIGEYLGRTFEEVKRRPVYLVDKLYGFADTTETGNDT